MLSYCFFRLLIWWVSLTGFWVWVSLASMGQSLLGHCVQLFSHIAEFYFYYFIENVYIYTYEGYSCAFFFCTGFGFGITVILTLYNELGRVPFCSLLWKRLGRICVNSSLNGRIFNWAFWLEIYFSGSFKLQIQFP